MFPVIVCIAKKEEDYIEEFVVYHLALGFKHIFLYDNEDVPTYENLLEKYKENVTFIHLPFNNYNKPVQYMALDHFVNNYLFSTDITHVAHIDIDEFIVLKKHDNICEFIEEYIVDDCQGIAMNWRFFGSSGKTEKTNEPVTKRFTKCQEKGNNHIKTLFKKDNFISFRTCHDVYLSFGHIKTTNKSIVRDAFNDNIDFSVIQLNHYKCKTLPEFRHIRTRQRADIIGDIHENIDESYRLFDINEIDELTAYNFYKKIPILDTYKRYKSLVETAFLNADNYISNISNDIINIHGMSGTKIRHFLNNLLTMEDARYLEIGTWKGSSVCSAMYNNNATIVCIDNWSEFCDHTTRNEFLVNFEKFKGKNNATFIESDCHIVDISILPKFNIYLYNGNYNNNNIIKSLTHYYDCLDNIFIFISFDWNWKHVRDETISSIEKLKLNVLHKKEIRMTSDNSHTNELQGKNTWWNGLYISILQK
jgi:hypothetical protein